MGVFARELGALYDAFRAGRPLAAAGAAPPVRRLRRLAADWLRGEMLESQLAYWRQTARRGARTAATSRRPPAPGAADLPRGRESSRLSRKLSAICERSAGARA